MTNDASKQFTKGGNPKAPALEVVLGWVDRAWNELSKELIMKSFEICGLTTSVDGSGDGQIACFKPNGSIGVKGIDLLQKFRAQKMARDGCNDYEEANLEEEINEESSFRSFNEDDILLFND